MKKTINLKNGCVIGDGMPKIAVPVCASTPEGMIRDAEEAVRSGAEILEFRADACAETADLPQMMSLLAEIRNIAQECVLLFTYRTSNEGGSAPGTDGRYREIVTAAICSGLIDLADIEQSSSDARILLREADAAGIPVVLSFHDFKKTPDAGALLARLLSMQEEGAAVAKIACMPAEERDVTEVLAASAMAREKLEIPHVLISMGGAGRVSRISAEVFGSAFSFGGLPGGGSAPGQLSAEALRLELDRVHSIRGRGRHLFLIGFMGAGKTTVSKELEKMTGMNLIEMDEEISEKDGRTIPEIFADDGEAYFRDLESGFIAGLYDREASVISCGGGAVLRPGNVSVMRCLGKIILLDVSAEEAFRRLSGEADGRPVLRGHLSAEGIENLMGKRRAAYENAADCVIMTDGKTPAEIAREVTAVSGRS